MSEPELWIEVRWWQTDAEGNKVEKPPDCAAAVAARVTTGTPAPFTRDELSSLARDLAVKAAVQIGTRDIQFDPRQIPIVVEGGKIKLE